MSLCVCVLVLVKQLYLSGISCSQNQLQHQSPSDDPPKGSALWRILGGGARNLHMNQESWGLEDDIQGFVTFPNTAVILLVLSPRCRGSSAVIPPSRLLCEPPCAGNELIPDQPAG